MFFTVADLLFFDTTSTYFEIDQADPATVDADGHTSAGFRTHGHSKMIANASVTSALTSASRATSSSHAQSGLPALS